MQSSVTSNVYRRVLGNGLTVLARGSTAAPVAAVVAHVHIGYFNEPDHWTGISHVVEHMLFKGSRRRPGKEQIAEDVRAYQGLGAAELFFDMTFTPKGTSISGLMWNLRRRRLSHLQAQAPTPMATGRPGWRWSSASRAVSGGRGCRR